MIGIKRIEFEQVEGFAKDCRTHTFFSWLDVNRFATLAARKAPSDGSYFKCVVSVTWVDNTTWRFRFDMTAAHAQQPTPVSSDFYCLLVFHRGDVAAPDGEDPTSYIAQLDEMYPGVRERATHALETYDLGPRA